MTMKTVVQNRASVVWLILVVLTLISWALGTRHGFGGAHVQASLLILVVAVFKVRLIGLYFMELRYAPWSLRGIFEGYCALLLMVLSAMYLVA